MINRIIEFSIKNKLFIGMFMIAWIGAGIYSMQKVPIDAVPDITNNQVQIITTSPNLGTEDIEQFVTYPVELAMANLPGVIEIRSVSRFGLSVVTIVFKDDMGTYLPRQLVSEKLGEVKNEIPQKFGSPFMGPISTGLGEIFQYTLEVDEEYRDSYTDTDLRTYQDWIVKRQMAMLPGVIEVNSFGGNVKQYEVAVTPTRLKSMSVTISEIFSALKTNNENTGGAYIVKNHKANFIRGEGLIRNLDDLNNIVVKTENGIPILIKDVATVQFGKAIRYGSVTKNGKGQAVGGMIMMFKGENSKKVIARVKERIIAIEKSLPDGIRIEGFLDRSDLIERTTNTVTGNLLEGGLIVIFILVLFLGNFRGGLIVASTIPLSLLFAYIMMNIFGVWSNLMSLGAIDFGIIVDGAVIIVESVVFYTVQRVKTIKGGVLSQNDLDDISYQSSSKMMNAAFFGQLIILIVFIPILTLQGIEGKMFRPMAMTFSFAVIGAMILCLTYVPMISAVFMSKKPSQKELWGDKFIGWLSDKYEPLLIKSLQRKTIILSGAGILLIIAVVTFSNMGGEFVPKLDEGDIAMHAILKPGSSLEETEKVCMQIEASILAAFPEVTQVVSKIGVAEIPTDPMPMDLADMFLILKPQSEWETFASKEELIEMIKAELSYLPGVNYEFSQPVEMRFNELMTGVRQDVAVKLFGEDLNVLAEYAEKMAKIINTVDGVADLKVEAIKGLPQMTIQYERHKIAQYGLNIKALNTLVRTAFSGEVAGVIFEGEKRFDLVVRLKEEHKKSMDDLKNIFISLPNGSQIPINEVAKISYQNGPMQISREGTNRRTYVGINVRGRDVESVVNEIKEKLAIGIDLPTGYYIKYGGSFENLQRAKSRLLLVVPAALVLIFVLLFLALKSMKQAAMIYMAIPLAAIGGVFSLWLRGMPFSISAGVGFIVLFGVAVLNGLVLISGWNELKAEGVSNLNERIRLGTKRRIRPILLTALTDVLGFSPMAISTSAGAEVQQPLATVVIGGMITATLLTLFVLPILYQLVESRKQIIRIPKMATVTVLLFSLSMFYVPDVRAQSTDSTNITTIEEAIKIGLLNNGNVLVARANVALQNQEKRAAYNLEKTRVDIQYGQYSSFETDLSISINQKLEFPTVYTSQRKLAKAKSIGSELQLSATKNELKQQIKNAWFHLTYFSEKKKLLIYQDSIYSKFLHAATLRYETEAISLLEKVAAETKVMELQNSLTMINVDINIQEQQLQLLLNDSNKLSFSPNVLKEKTLLNLSDANNTSNNPLLIYAQQKIEIANAEKRVQNAKMLPDLSVGYFNQSLIGNPTENGGIATSADRFSGIQAGIAIPLFLGSYRANVKSAKLKQQIAVTNSNYYKTTIKSNYTQQLQEVLKFQTSLTYYQEKALPQAELIINNTEKSYENGAIGYIEYFQNINQGLALKFNYLNTLNNYNQAIISLEYLVGQ